MNYREETMDLFSVPDEYYLAHCISADFGMGKGIVVEFNRRFDMKNLLQRRYPDYVNNWHRWKQTFDCILEGRVFNLITKERYYDKPTYASVAGALYCMKAIALQYGVKKIAMPAIGCGLDKLNWDKMRDIVQGVFENSDIEILVCRQ